MAIKSANRKKKEPTLAAGDKGILKKRANKDDIKSGNFTQVTTLSYDEVDPS
ncbi:MAG: hypothetical protein PHO01_03085 [Desulfotomaculaceae bacterium]|nr:hypothetical protein [Desulfotomaculaceae bacterium]